MAINGMKIYCNTAVELVEVVNELKNYGLKFVAKQLPSNGWEIELDY